MIITVLSVTFGALGLALLLLLLRSLRIAGDASRLQPYRYRGEGTVDLLNYAALIDDGIVLVLPRSVADGQTRRLGDGHQRRGAGVPPSEKAIACETRERRRAMAIWG